MCRLVALVVVTLLAAAPALAVSSGKVLEFKGGAKGTVKFDGTLHKKAMGNCKDCHVQGIFPEKKLGAVKISMKDIIAGKQCGVCHDGKKAFEAKANCERCHVPPPKK